jgi:hypothetical protein
MLFVAAALGFLEIRQPFFFVQDDNLSQFLPVILQGCRGAFNDHVFPTWNPHQFLGSPTASLGTYALTYPPTYFSYAIARWIVGNEYATIDVFCIGHLLVGYIAMFWACRQVGVQPGLSTAAAICFSLSGYFLIAGRGWYYMTPFAAWSPWLVGLLAILHRENVGWKWMLATGGVFGALFHAGNAQMWFYAMMMFSAGVLILWVCMAIDLRRAIPAGAALVLGLAIAMPLMLPQYLETAKVPRVAGDSPIVRFLPAMLFPYPLATANLPGVLESPHNDQMGQLYYAGTILSTVALIGMLSILAHRWTRRLVADNVWLVLAWIAILLALGRFGGLWYFLSKIPPFTGFKHSFKFVPVAALFMLVGGGLMVQRAFRRSRAAWKWEWGIVALSAALMGYHIWLPKPSFCDYAFQPYPKLPGDVRQLLEEQEPSRIYAIGPRRSLAAEYGLSMMHQMPTVWGLNALEGYDPLVREGPRFGAIAEKITQPGTASGMSMELGPAEMGFGDVSPQRLLSESLHRSGMEDIGFWGHSFRIDLAQSLDALTQYGVRWVVVYSGPQNPQVAEGNGDDLFWKTDPVGEQLLEAVKQHGRLALRRDEICIYELPEPAPMAFAADHPRIALPVAFDASGITVDTSSLADGCDVVINVLAAPFLESKIDGRSQRGSVDAWNRLTLHVPRGTRRLSVRYRPPWLIGIGLGAVLAAFSLAIMRWRARWSAAVEATWIRFPTRLVGGRRAA